MPTLFNQNNAEGGYRLRYMEIFNWGTFHGKVYKISPNGKTSLLTGANGSGKTTLIDALLTLLVPSGKRFYNQSSGTDQKKDRDENSYFWGNYGKTFLESEERSSTEQLRKKSDNPYSVLLACFQNAGTQHTITLVQIRWYSAGSLKKVFIVAPYPLNINDHFGTGHFDIRGEWRKKLMRQYAKTDLFDSFKDYAARFSELFGLKEKALSLFNQTVGIKVLGDLTQFIRSQMLEEPFAEEQFKNLYDHYTDLMLSHKAIQKDERQLQLLEPVIKHKELLADADTRLQEVSTIQEQLPCFLDSLELDLLEQHIQQLEKDISADKSEMLEVEKAIVQLEAEQKNLITQKASLNIDVQIQLLENNRSSEVRERDNKKAQSDDYSKLAEKLGLHTEPTEASFKENLVQAEQLNNKLETEYNQLLHSRFIARSAKEKNDNEIASIEENIASLQARRNRIPQELVHVRARLVELLETGEDELPFVGELLKVKDGESHWEDAIERVLHSFSMQLLIPEKYNKAVNHFVHTNNLRTKLVYQRIDGRGSDTLKRWPTGNDELVNKLDIKQSGAYSKWLEQQLLERFNYFCTDELDIFHDSFKAITSNGLIRNANRHEKDDRPNRWSKLHYTLGWDNKETIQLLVQEKQRLQKESDRLFQQEQSLTPRIKSIEERRPLIILIADVKSYQSINWQQHAVKIEGINRQIDELRKTSDKYETLTLQLEEVEKVLGNRRRDKEGYLKRLGKKEEEHNQSNLRKLQLQTEPLADETMQRISAFIQEAEIEKLQPESLAELSLFRKKLTEKVNGSHRLASDGLNKLQITTVSLISKFVNPSESILKEFPDWSGDVMNISADLNSLNELEDLYRTIRNQRLVEHKRRFKDYMDKSMLDALTNYRAWLTTEEDKIKEIIEELNIPLKKITFNKNPDTYLQLECRANKEQGIKEFKEKLSATIPNTIEFAAQKDEAYREAVFNRIKDLISELQKEETWRRRVTDVRNWLTFSAREYSFAEGKAGQYHDNTASYSGGQKAQFTYAILGAAIAHQFGIFQPGKQYKSLRFITVDEAFSKLDPEKSQFLMEFCEQLNLQLLVVTPLDKINIAEPYINAVHFVEIKNKQHSVVYNLTMDEYYQKKEEFKQLAEQSA
ncbi:AAA family ATPase [Chitinophaga horti]|uniref:AAA family ATPase n=1 Tax=Chitinophaga horti TaxID=2920382 RepID=A0ABY6IZM5_9BACT|nr:ATP-binding protein [Chitinophaga horti]UYQ92841.1 AAA family ATPase [Chitinophaga horti]